MLVSTIRLELRLAECHSLKDKRHVLRGMLESIRRKFNVSIAEVAHHDAWQTAVIGVAVVGSEHRFLEKVLTEVEQIITSQPGVDIVGVEHERW
ncbi:MAG: DUF503 domain-containing protein [Armatimonadetes bacterium]|jgi:uncharacterized protein YlxP (DUF503 family)|nr:DUF503 domain-containing protein [Armatimonadota bacterium]